MRDRRREKVVVSNPPIEKTEKIKTMFFAYFCDRKYIILWRVRYVFLNIHKSRVFRIIADIWTDTINRSVTPYECGGFVENGVRLKYGPLGPDG